MPLPTIAPTLIAMTDHRPRSCSSSFGMDLEGILVLGVVHPDENAAFKSQP